MASANIVQLKNFPHIQYYPTWTRSVWVFGSLIDSIKLDMVHHPFAIPNCHRCHRRCLQIDFPRRTEKGFLFLCDLICLWKKRMCKYGALFNCSTTEIKSSPIKSSSLGAPTSYSWSYRQSTLLCYTQSNWIWNELKCVFSYSLFGARSSYMYII